ncbi:MAG: hypothetical protein H9W81_13600 [Enterococcus sp.]|nr:hypothetical protein [Enterococcus sp.]
MDIHASSGKYLNDDTVRESYWYHATDGQDWMGSLLSNDIPNIPLVHVGTERTALEVILDKHIDSPHPISIFRIKLKANAVLNETIFFDDNDWPETLKEDRPAGDVYRYVNRWEAAGSISLLVDPRYLEIVSVERLTSYTEVWDRVA